MYELLIIGAGPAAIALSAEAGASGIVRSRILIQNEFLIKALIVADDAYLSCVAPRDKDKIESR